MPPAPTGVADYAFRLLQELRRFGSVEVNASRADVFLYHLGNNQLHREIYRRALERPGVVVLHDAVLHHFFLGALDRQRYIEEFVYNYGEWARGLAERLWEDRARSAQDPRYFRYPMLRRITEVSRAVVVHNPAAARMVREHCAAARVVEVPFPVWRPAVAPECELVRWRKQAGLGLRTVLFGVFGHLRESKRLGTVLRAWCEVQRARVPAALVLAGDFQSEELERAVAPLLEGVIRAERLSDAEFWKLVAACDVVVNLRYPAAGETSGVGMTAMGLGKAVLFSATEETSMLPPDACLRIEPGIGERASLVEHMIWLATFPGHAREVGRRAAVWVREHHAPEVVAERYWELLRALI
jgi:glycosyltransferase involved in cell wall biosynthesis